MVNLCQADSASLATAAAESVAKAIDWAPPALPASSVAVNVDMLGIVAEGASPSNAVDTLRTEVRCLMTLRDYLGCQGRETSDMQAQTGSEGAVDDGSQGSEDGIALLQRPYCFAVSYPTVQILLMALHATMCIFGARTLEAQAVLAFASYLSFCHICVWLVCSGASLML